MSSELLLSGRDITKIYGSPLHPLSLLISALTRKPSKGERYNVLNGIDIDIYRGETVGIMGRNGAGKSTLLGILGNVIPASTGKIQRFGKIAVLLELGSGFNLNLTGIENARMYCRIMGMSGDEVDYKIKQIEEFSELGKYFYLPIRTYSSGMYSRLAFSAAIHVDADLIIIDESLSVGDASFKMKCYAAIDKMKESGMTFLLVSHSQNLIANFCTRAIIIENGQIAFDGEPLGAVGAYKEIRAEIESQRKPKVITTKQKTNIEQECQEMDKLSIDNFSYREEKKNGQLYSVVGLTISANVDVKYPAFALGIRNSTGIAICSISSDEIENALPSFVEGQSIDIEVKFKNHLTPGPYFVTSYASEYVGDVKSIISMSENALRFDIVKPKKGAGVVDLDMNINWLNKLSNSRIEKESIEKYNQ